MTNMMPAKILCADVTNTIIHGDCIEIMRGMSDKSVDMVLTDIPYGVVTRSHGSLRKAGNFDKGVADDVTFDLAEFLELTDRIAAKTLYIFCASEQVSQIRAHFSKYTTRHCIWEKTNPSPMNGQHMWLSSIENCIYVRKKGATFNEHCKSAVWRFPNGSSKIHPTQKPVKLFQYLIETSSVPGDLIFDPCAGSGTTGVAAKNAGRNFILIERDEQSYLKAKERLDGIH